MADKNPWDELKERAAVLGPQLKFMGHAFAYRGMRAFTRTVLLSLAKISVGAGISKADFVSDAETAYEIGAKE